MRHARIVTLWDRGCQDSEHLSVDSFEVNRAGGWQRRRVRGEGGPPQGGGGGWVPARSDRIAGPPEHLAVRSAGEAHAPRARQKRRHEPANTRSSMNTAIVRLVHKLLTVYVSDKLYYVNLCESVGCAFVAAISRIMTRVADWLLHIGYQ